MISNVFSKVFGSRNDRILKKIRKQIDRINQLESSMEQLSDAELRDKKGILQQRVQAGSTLDELLPEAFAIVREGAKRVFKMRHYDQQLIGAIILHQGRIAEMRTGEGKTLMATLAAYLNAMSGKGVHIITVNDYLAARDAQWMGRLYSFLGLTTGVIINGLDHDQRQQAYACDIVYGTNNEFGFDYLRDNMAFAPQERVQRELNFAVVDEVDSILIDEARTPLIISGPSDDSSDLYTKINEFVPKLTRKMDAESESESGDFTVDEKAKAIQLTEEGHIKVEEMMVAAGLLREGDSLYDPGNISLIHHLYAALRAHVLFQKNVEYIVSNGQIVIVDEFTGRTMPGRRWSDGLHQAVEAKEHVAIQRENQTLASITFQNYFRLYQKLAGMTGTADTEAFEFQQIYHLEVVVIPTHLPMVRKDLPDQVYLTFREKFDAIVIDIRDCLARQQPVLVGTASIETSEYLSDLLTKAGIQHEVLNAKQHEREAEIVAQAGRPGAVTIATNMAGRGTDIVLGGSLDSELKEMGENATEAELNAAREAWKVRHQQVIASGGLHIIGTERHESRRVDNQLRGRSGRQGDPGSSRFYLSMEDNLMRIFASEKISGLMKKLGMEEGEPIEHPWVTRAIENAQRKVEGHNFDIRKQLLEYDDVANDQRKVIYNQRRELMAQEEITETIDAIRADVLNLVINHHIPPQSLEEQWSITSLEQQLRQEFHLDLPIAKWLDEDHTLHEEPLREKILNEMVAQYRHKESLAGITVVRHFEKAVMLQVLDNLWREHLAAMDYLRKGIHLRGYAQKNPKQEYKREAFELFTQLLDRIKHEVVRIISQVEVRAEEDVSQIEQQRRAKIEMEYHHEAAATLEQPQESDNTPQQQPYVREGRKVGRNDPCPCGSGKKYKQCHGQIN
ncbi:MAG: preprotein translocase subunit SecA [Gammaproteobacteria bacterium]|nr:preprotein translocase subunit SecA [Gammaproteobacteria bacterium]